MRKSTILAAGLILAFTALAPLCAGHMPVSDPDVIERTEPNQAVLGSDFDVLAWPPKRLYSRRAPVDQRSVAADAKRVAFLPMLNRSQKRIHVNFLRSISETLAAHASIFLDRPVVSPELIDAILKSEGQAPWFGVPNHFRYSNALLDRVHTLTGAGVVVWSEFRDDGQLELSAKEFAANADAAPWQGIVLDAHEDLDRFIYDAPRALLAEMVKLRRIHTVGRSGRATDADGIDAEVEAALSLFWKGDPGSLIESEHALSRLIVQFPNVPEPWVELAFVRAVRPLLFGTYHFHALMNEGPNPARHIAHLLPNLDERQRARLRFVDHLYTGHRKSTAEFDEMIQSFSPDAPERALLAWFHHKQDPAKFGAAKARMPGVLGRVLSALAPLPGPIARQTRAAEMLAESNPLAFQTPLLLLTLRPYFQAQNNWSGEAATWTLSAVFGMTHATTALRETCLLLRATSKAACFQVLEAFMQQYLSDPEFSAKSLVDVERWEETLGRVVEATYQPKVPVFPTHAVPAEVLSTESDTFPGLWYLSHQIIRTANEIFSIRDSLPLEGESAIAILSSRPRDRVFAAVDGLLAAAYQPAVIGGRRAQPNEYRPYHTLLRDVSQQYELETAFVLRERFDRYLKIPTSHDLDLMSLISRNPYQMVNLDASFKKAKSGEFESLSDWLIQLVPMPPDLFARALRIGINENNRDEVSARLERELARRQNDELATTLEVSYYLRAIDKRKRLAVIDAAVAEFPFNEKLKSRAAWLAIYAKRLDLARDRFTAMLESGTDLKDACRGLAQIARRLDEMDHAEEVLLSCINRSTSNWHKHDMLHQVANIRRDQDRFQDSQAAVDRARKQVGGSAAVLSGTAENFELAGRLDEAARLWKRSWDAYKKAGSWEAAVALAHLEIRRGNTDRALEIFNELFADTRRHGRSLLELGRVIYTARDDLEGFREVCLRAGAQGWVPLAEFEWDVFHDREAAFKALDEAEALMPAWAIIPTLRAKILLESGQPVEALAELHRAQEIDGIMWAFRLIPQAQLAAGEIDAVRQTVRKESRYAPWEVYTWEFKARLETHEGKFAAARRSIAWALRHLQKPGDDGRDGWWYSIRPLLLMDEALMTKAGGRDENLALEARLTQIANRLPTDAKLLLALARVRDHLGMKDEATQSWSSLAMIEPRHPALRERPTSPAARD